MSGYNGNAQANIIYSFASGSATTATLYVNTMYLATLSGNLGSGGTLEYSVDGGTSWTTVVNKSYVNEIAIDMRVISGLTLSTSNKNNLKVKITTVNQDFETTEYDPNGDPYTQQNTGTEIWRIYDISAVFSTPAPTPAPTTAPPTAPPTPAPAHP